MIDPPHVLEIGGQPWRVEYVHGDSAGVTETAEVGLTIGHKRLIKLDEDQAHPALLDTMLHEVLHAITIMTGLREELGKELDEKVVNRISPVLLDAIRSNAQLVAWLTD
jgi:hypothetical protein